VPADDFASRSEATAERRMRVIDAGVDHRDGDSPSASAERRPDLIGADLRDVRRRSGCERVYRYIRMNGFDVRQLPDCGDFCSRSAQRHAVKQLIIFISDIGW